MKRKTILSLGLCAALCLPLSGCGSADVNTSGSGAVVTSAQNDSSFDLDDYKALVSESYSTIDSVSTYTAALASYELQVWDKMDTFGASVSENTISESGEKFLTENYDVSFDDLADTYDSVRKQYKEISLVAVEGTEADRINDAYERLYDSFEDIYKSITSTGTSYSAFKSRIAESGKNYVDAVDDLTLYLDIEASSDSSN